MLFLAAGAVLYYGILLVFLQVKDLELLSYLGMDAASSGYPFSRLPGLLLDTYKQVAAFFFLPGSANTFTSGWMAVLDLAALALGGAASCCAWGRRGSGGHAGAPWAGWPCWLCSLWASTSARSSAPGPPPPPDEIRLCAGLSGGGAAG